jgi:hypothetical protein
MLALKLYNFKRNDRRCDNVVSGPAYRAVADGIGTVVE